MLQWLIGTAGILALSVVVFWRLWQSERSRRLDMERRLRTVHQRERIEDDVRVETDAGLVDRITRHHH